MWPPPHHHLETSKWFEETVAHAVQNLVCEPTGRAENLQGHVLRSIDLIKPHFCSGLYINFSSRSHAFCAYVPAYFHSSSIPCGFSRLRSKFAQKPKLNAHDNVSSMARCLKWSDFFIFLFLLRLLPNQQYFSHVGMTSFLSGSNQY